MKRKPRRHRTNRPVLIRKQETDPWPQVRVHMDVESILVTMREHEMSNHANVISLRLCGYSDDDIAKALDMDPRHVRRMEKSAHAIARLLLLRKFSQK